MVPGHAGGPAPTAAQDAPGRRFVVMSTAADGSPAPTLRAALDAVPAYIPGKPASAPEGVTAYKLSSNELSLIHI